MRSLLILTSIVTAPLLVAGAQTLRNDPVAELFPEAASFSEKIGDPPHFEAYAAAASAGEPI